MHFLLCYILEIIVTLLLVKFIKLKILWVKYKFNWENSCFLQGKAPKFGPKLETTLVHLQISLYQIFAWNTVNWLNFSIINQTKTGYQDASPKHGSIWSNKYLLNGCFTSFIFFQQFNSYFVEFSWKNCINIWYPFPYTYFWGRDALETSSFVDDYFLDVT